MPKANGYSIVKRVGHPRAHKGWVYEHVAEEKLGRFLRVNEIVHHVNHDKTDNRPENLAVMSQSDHARLHASTGVTRVDLTCYRCGVEFKRELRQVKRGKLTFCGNSCRARFFAGT